MHSCYDEYATSIAAGVREYTDQNSCSELRGIRAAVDDLERERAAFEECHTIVFESDESASTVAGSAAVAALRRELKQRSRTDEQLFVVADHNRDNKLSFSFKVFKSSNH
jgi:hypothetical protein